MNNKITGLCPPSVLVADRFNKGKTEFSRLYIPALEAEARVFMKGAEKYPDSPDGTPNWHKLWGEDTKNVVCNSALRHLFAIMQGEDEDKETGLPHAAHVRANMSMLIKHYNDTKETK